MIDPVSPGDAFPLARVDALNEVIAAANTVNRQGEEPSPRRRAGRNDCVVRVSNAAQSALPEASIVRVYESAVLFAKEPEGFEFDPLLKANLPNPAEPGRPAVLLEDLEPNMPGRALISGCITLKVDLKDAAHRFATPKADDASMLESAASGEFALLTFESADTGGEPTAGEQLCTVIFPVAQGGGGSIQLVQVKSVNTSAATVTVSPVKLEPENTPNYSSPASPTRTAYYLRS